MPSKKKKYNARFPAGRIKKIMQSDEEVGKVAQAVPIIISRTLELFVESLLAKTLKITNSRNAKTLSPSHMKQCIMSESRFDFLRELVKNIPDISVADEAAQDSSGPYQDNSGPYIDMQQPYDLSKPSTSSEANISPARNGNSSSIRNGAPATYVTATTVQIPTMDSIPTAVIEHRSELKRQWDIVHASRKQQKEKISSVIHHTSEATECSPPKIARMDSAPTGYYDTVKNYSNKRLQHQPKSMPCTSKEVNTNKQSIIPAPIVNIDVCNRPIVKIDYSNLALHDKELTDSGSRSPPNTPLTCINPVINIDLSNIATQSNNDLPKVSNSAGCLRPSLELDEDYDNI